MTIYAHVTNGTVDQVGTPPATAFAEGRWWDLRDLALSKLATCGWVEITEVARPADTPTQTSDMSWTISGGKAVQTWTVRDKTPDELAADTRSSNNADLRAKAELALDANAAFLALGSPTNAQVVTHVQRLTRENTALIRLVIGALDSTSGT